MPATPGPRATEIDHAIHSAALDEHTCEWCRAHDGDDWDFIDPARPELPSHHCTSPLGCRCVYIFTLHSKPQKP